MIFTGRAERVMHNELDLPKPLIGTLLHPSLIRHLRAQKYLPSTALGAAAAKKTGVMAFWFCFDDVDIVKKEVRGLRQGPNGKWGQDALPYPDVLYQCVRVKDQALGSKEKRVLASLLSRAMLVNSRDVIGKWEGYKAMRGSPILFDLMPETRLYKNEGDLLDMLATHRVVLAKRGYGLGGMHMSRIYQSPPGGYCIEVSGSRLKQQGLSFDEALSQTIATASGPFVLQEEVKVLSINRRRHFIRAIVCKDGTGQWRAGCNYLILGAPGQFAVNRHQGGRQFTLVEGLRTLRLRRGVCKEIERRIDYTAKLVARAIDRAMGRMGELGLDFVLDDLLRLWLLEVNAMPHKDHLPFRRKAERLAPFINIMEYGRYLFVSDIASYEPCATYL